MNFYDFMTFPCHLKWFNYQFQSFTWPWKHCNISPKIFVLHLRLADNPRT